MGTVQIQWGSLTLTVHGDSKSPRGIVVYNSPKAQIWILGLASQNTDVVVFWYLEGSRLTFPKCQEGASVLGDGKPPKYKHVASA